MRDALRQFIVEDLRCRIELALAWLYQEYVIAQGYLGEDDPRTDYEQYDACLCGLLHALKDKLEPRDRLVPIRRVDCSQQIFNDVNQHRC